MRRKSQSPRHDLRSEYDIACPKCGQANKLSLEITCTAILTINSTEACDDHYWDETSPCSCDACGHNGTVAEFRVAAASGVQS